ncbi:MAG: OmpH family outer membrane protein [Flavobacteriaceae bacterium]|nr:OmpH family outer membrane protein [Flavobacteriaceae bacterium]
MKRISILTFLLFVNITVAQRGVKIGYIDTEYILENLTEYSEVSERLEEKAQSWKDEISKRSREIDQKKESLNSERILLTKDLIEELESEIEFEEQELNEYQQKRFGTRGDLILQKQQLTQPIQDQIFNAIKEIAKSKNYDFIFDKSSDIVMLYSNRRHDISDQILRNISRANNRKKLDSRKDKREAENETIVDESIISEKIEQDIDEKIDNKPEDSEPKRKLTVKELLEQRKQKNSNKRKVKD